MDEHQAPGSDSNAAKSFQESPQEEINKSIEAEIHEMEKYKWCLGVQLQHDPLRDRSLNDIYCEWIDKYAADFRKFWSDKKTGGQQPLPN